MNWAMCCSRSPIWPRHLHLDPEGGPPWHQRAKFERRFRQVESWLMEVGRTPAESTLAEMDGLWERAKLEEKR